MTLYEGTLDVFAGRYSSRTQTLSMLSTCRQIRYEALPIFYFRNTFDFTDINSDFSQFVKIVTLRVSMLSDLFVLITTAWNFLFLPRAKAYRIPLY
jgi:hypothetical protein